MIRIGYSEDIHQVEKGKKLVLGGIYLPNEDGLKAHSDGDVVLHAIGESILGALALGDLGTFFPDSDPKYKDISSELLLREIVKMMMDHKYEIGNIDVQIAAKRPYLHNLLPLMRNKIALLLNTKIENVSLKAMTFNDVGPIGEGRAIKATSVVLLTKK